MTKRKNKYDESIFVSIFMLIVLGILYIFKTILGGLVVLTKWLVRMFVKIGHHREMREQKRSNNKK